MTGDTAIHPNVKRARKVVRFGVALVILCILSCGIAWFQFTEIDRIERQILQVFSEVDATLLHEETRNGISATGCAGERLRQLYVTDLSYYEVNTSYQHSLLDLRWKKVSATDLFLINPEIAWIRERQERSFRGYRMSVAYIEVNDLTILRHELNEYDLDSMLETLNEYETVYLVEIARLWGHSCF